MDLDFTKALAGVTALAATLTALATATGAFDSMERNEPQWSAAVFSAAALAGVCIVVAALFKNRAKWIPLGIGIPAFLFAAVAGIVFVIQAQGDRPPPNLKAQFKTGPSLTLTGSVKVEGMTSREILKVKVYGARPEGTDQDSFGKEDLLFNAGLGANASGKIELPVEIPLPATTYNWISLLAWIGDKPTDCFYSPKRDFKSVPGCIVMRVPPKP